MPPRESTPQAVVFDLDGVLLDSEQRWNLAKEDVVRERGGSRRPDAPERMMGMSAPEWSTYIHDDLGVELPPEEIDAEVVARVKEDFGRRLPLLPGADRAVRELAERWPLALASSSNREIIDLVLSEARFDRLFRVTISSEEVARGKPAPDVYLEAARRLAADPGRCLAVEDSANGLRSAAAAGMTVIAVPNQHYPPSREALGLAAESVAVVGDITPSMVESVAEGRR